MAVPKQKQSHARTNKRRSTHKISAPAINACPQCHQPRRPHRVCPHCGHAFTDGEVILCCDRRLVVRECDCFCFGTAMGGAEG